MPAAGKSTMGKCLATQLKYQFIDLDQEIEKKVGKTIAQLFEDGGEAQFRSIERETLLENLQLQDTVLATGGGTPCFEDNMQKITESSLCIYLLSDLKQSTQRIQTANLLTRPMFARLTEVQIYQRLEQLYEQRHPYYAQAHVFLVQGS